mmetsp:Transcript_38455/g.79921  ORF Transcript_38455/g.79921 Transcript_38455/m.79921 type:complete len:112 (-) Transcript_38455:87-422(-)
MPRWESFLLMNDEWPSSWIIPFFQVFRLTSRAVGKETSLTRKSASSPWKTLLLLGMMGWQDDNVPCRDVCLFGKEQRSKSPDSEKSDNRDGPQHVPKIHQSLVAVQEEIRT